MLHSVTRSQTEAPADAFYMRSDGSLPALTPHQSIFEKLLALDFELLEVAVLVGLPVEVVRRELDRPKGSTPR
jgi:hypothetical protein